MGTPGAHSLKIIKVGSSSEPQVSPCPFQKRSGAKYFNLVILLVEQVTEMKMDFEYSTCDVLKLFMDPPLLRTCISYIPMSQCENLFDLHASCTAFCQTVKNGCMLLPPLL